MTLKYALTFPEYRVTRSLDSLWDEPKLWPFHTIAKTHIYVCMYVCVCVGVCVCVWGGGWAGGCVGVCACACECM